MIKTLGRCEWKDIKVGEVFAEIIDGYLIYIAAKLPGNIKNMLLLTDNYATHYPGITDTYAEGISELHKLPLSVQRLWADV